VHEHEIFRRKLLKGNGRGRIREGKRGPTWVFCPGAHEFPVTPVIRSNGLQNYFSNNSEKITPLNNSQSNIIKSSSNQLNTHLLTHRKLTNGELLLMVL